MFGPDCITCKNWDRPYCPGCVLERRLDGSWGRTGYEPLGSTSTISSNVAGGYAPPLSEDGMSLVKATEIMREFQERRKGIGKYQWNEDPLKNKDLPYTPAEIGKAIDKAIEVMEGGRNEQW